MHEQHSHKLLLKREMKVDVTSRLSIMNDVALLKEAGDFVHDDGIAINYSITDFRGEGDAMVQHSNLKDTSFSDGVTVDEEVELLVEGRSLTTTLNNACPIAV